VIYCNNIDKYKTLVRRLYRTNRVTFKFTMLYTLEQNRVIERLNRTLIISIRVLLLEVGLSIEL
jgi:hypothetical protein